MQDTGERADEVLLYGPAITAGLEGLQQTQGAGGRADVVCGRVITTAIDLRVVCLSPGSNSPVSRLFSAAVSGLISTARIEMSN